MVRMRSKSACVGVSEGMYNPLTDTGIAWMTALRRPKEDTTPKVILFYWFSPALLNQIPEIMERMMALGFVGHSD